jgi:DNA-binding NarL/FixJ family response regulator
VSAVPTCSVVICDDVADFRELMVLWIDRAEGLQVVGEGANGREAIELARVHQPAVLLLDLSMPVMDGLEALPHILAEAPRTRVVVLTGLTSPTLREKVLAAGAWGYIEKGERPSVVVSTVQAACSAEGSAAVSDPQERRPIAE